MNSLEILSVHGLGAAIGLVKTTSVMANFVVIFSMKPYSIPEGRANWLALVLVKLRLLNVLRMPRLAMSRCAAKDSTSLA